VQYSTEECASSHTSCCIMKKSFKQGKPCGVKYIAVTGYLLWLLVIHMLLMQRSYIRRMMTTRPTFTNKLRQYNRLHNSNSQYYISVYTCYIYIYNIYICVCVLYVLLVLYEYIYWGWTGSITHFLRLMKLSSNAHIFTSNFQCKLCFYLTVYSSYLSFTYQAGTASRCRDYSVTVAFNSKPCYITTFLYKLLDHDRRQTWRSSAGSLLDEYRRV
jgi:hypothetical protein